ncbi:unnamed protein product [Hapterophycus canaliculatus]
MGRLAIPRGLVLTLVTLLSCSRCGLSFIRSQTCPFSLDGHARQAKTCAVVKRQAATTVSGGVPSGKRERGKSAASSGRETTPSYPSQSPISPRANSGKIPTSTAQAGATASAAGEHALQIGTNMRGSASRVEHGAKESEGPSSSSLPRVSVPAPKSGIATAAGAGTSSDSADGKAEGEAVALQGTSAVHAAGREQVTASAVTAPQKKRGVAAGPETTAAEKVLTLLDIGLVAKEEVVAYYDALSELERTTREAKAAAAAAAASPKPPSPPSSTMPFSPRDGPLSLVPLPAVCAALGAAGTQSLHLAGGFGTAISIFGAMAGVAIGGLVVIGDDPLGRLARAAGSAVARSAVATGGAAGKGVSDSIASAAGAAAGAVEQAVVKAPSNFVGGLARSISSVVSAAFGSAAALPGSLVTKAADGAKGALKDTSDAVVAIPGEVARKATRVAGSALQSTSAAAASAVGGALQSTSEAAMTAVKGSSPKQAAQRLNGGMPSPGKTLAGFVSSLPSRAGAGESKKAEKRAATTMPSASAGSEWSATPSKQDEGQGEPGGIPVQELEAKMLSVKKALERFDTVKARIEKAETSGTLFEAVGMTRSMNMSAEREKREEARAAAATAAVAQRVKDSPMESTTSRYIAASQPKTAQKTTASTGRKSSDQDRRKQVAERLLEKASKRAAEAKAGLKAAAASARRGAEVTSPAVATSVAAAGTSDL